MKLVVSIILFVLFISPGCLAQSYGEIRKDVNQYKIYTAIEEALTKPEDVFRLRLNDVKINEKLLEESLPKFQNLRELQLSNTFISKIPSSIGYLKHLQFLEVGHLKKQNPNLVTIPRSIQKLKKLTYINLIGNPNLDWHKTILSLSKLPKLINLALMYNNFKKLPKKMTALSTLKMVWLGKNPNLDLKDTFSKLSKLDSLSQLGLGGNGHTKLTDEIILLKNIRNLWLSGNNWKNLNGLQHLPKLTQLSLHNCNLSLLPTAIIQCEKLEYLSLVKNPNMDFNAVLKTIPISIQTLNLSDNKIKELSINSLGTTNMKKLILKNNKILEEDLKKYELINKNLEVSYK